MTEECVFCSIVAGEAPASIAHRDETRAAFMVESGGGTIREKTVENFPTPDSPLPTPGRFATRPTKEDA